MFAEIMTALCAIVVLFSIIMIFKAIRTYKMHNIIDDAISFYNVRCIDNNVTSLVDYEDAERFERTMLRLYDWGYKRILPKEKFEIIKPYIIERRWFFEFT